MWYVLWTKDCQHDWLSFIHPEEADKKVDQLVKDGVLEDEILILNASDPDIIMDVNEFREHWS